jgi:hypothetical protein
MVAYSFQKRFVEPIRWGLGLGLDVADEVLSIGEPKRQTIRAVGKRVHARPGDKLQLYTGMRTKQCQQIGVARCISVMPIHINIEARIIKSGGVQLRRKDLDGFARRDGFKDFADMRAFWLAEHGRAANDFHGLIIKWEPIVL